MFCVIIKLMECAITYSPIEHYLRRQILFVSIDRTYSDIAIPCVSSDNDAQVEEKQINNKLV